MSKFTHVISIDGIEKGGEYDKNYQACVQSLRNQTNSNFIIAEDKVKVDTYWLIISYVSGVLHPDFVEKVQARFRPQPCQVLTNGYLLHNDKVYESVCDTTRSFIVRPGEVNYEAIQEASLYKERLSEHLYCEYSAFTDCAGVEMEVEEWM